MNEIAVETGVDEGNMQEGSLDDILNGNEPEAELQAPEATEPEAVETIDRPRDEQGRFLPKQETGEESQATEEVEPVAQAASPAAEPETPLEHPALLGERRRRQAAEQEAAQLRAYLQQYQQQPQAQAAPTDFWEDPNAFLDNFGNRLLSQWQQQQQIERVNQAEAAARQSYPDFDEKIMEFRQAAQLNPALVQQMQAAPNPAEFAYTTGKRIAEVNQVGSLDAYAAKIRQEAIAEYEAKLAASLPSITAPTTTATARSVGTRTGPEWAGPKSLNDILNS